MGSASSVALTVDEARRRLGEDECDRFEEGFKRILGLQHDGLSLGLFVSTLVAELSPTCPGLLAHAIFRAFNTSKSGVLSLHEFLVGLCIVRTGTIEERLELVFRAANSSQNGRLEEWELRHYVALLDDDALMAHFDSLFHRRGSVVARDWVEWAQEDVGDDGVDGLLGWVVEFDRALGGRAPLPPTSAVSAATATPVTVLRPRKWSIDGTPPPSPQLAAASRTPPVSPLHKSALCNGRSSPASWASATTPQKTPPLMRRQQSLDFSAEGLGSLKALFSKCREQSASGAVDLEALQAAFAHSKSAVPPTLVSAIFERLDENGDGVVDIRDFVGGLCCCFGGSVEDKLEFCFSLFAQEVPAAADGAGGEQLHHASVRVLDEKGMALLLKSLWSVEEIHAACMERAHEMEEPIVPLRGEKATTPDDDDDDWSDDEARLPPVLVLERQTSSSPEVVADIAALVHRAMNEFGGGEEAEAEPSSTGGQGHGLTLQQFTAWAQQSGSSAKAPGPATAAAAAAVGGEAMGTPPAGGGGVRDLSSSLTERLERATFVDIGVCPPDPATELRLVREVLLQSGALFNPLFDPATPGPAGTVWCVVDKAWVDSWCDAVGLASFSQVLSPRPGGDGTSGVVGASPMSCPTPPPQKKQRKFLPPLDNRSLVDSWGRLLPTVFHREQFELIGVEVARTLAAWYGDSTGGLLERRVIVASRDHNRQSENNGGECGEGSAESTGSGCDSYSSSSSSSSSSLVLELYPPLVTVALVSSSDDRAVGLGSSSLRPSRSWIASSGDDVDTLLLVAKEQFSLSYENAARLWFRAREPAAGHDGDHGWDLVSRFHSSCRQGRGAAKAEGAMEDEDDSESGGDGPEIQPVVLTLGCLCAGEPMPQFLLELCESSGSWPTQGATATATDDGTAAEAAAVRRDRGDSWSHLSTPDASPGKRARLFQEEVGSSEMAATSWCGLANLGNTCYLNATLQALRHARLFCDYFSEPLQLGDLPHRHQAPGSPSRLESATPGANGGGEKCSDDDHDPGDAGGEEEVASQATVHRDEVKDRESGGDDEPPLLLAAGDNLPLPYMYDLNTSSKWGARGKLAVALSDLFVGMRAAETAAAAAASSLGEGESHVAAAVVRPSSLKAQLAAFDSMFAGFEQQDASEALAKILEGVGEDVNRIGASGKPYTELLSSDSSAGRSDEEVAREWWAAHEAREKHVVTSLLTGQLKVTTTCTATGASSTTFEQFVSLTVPLPEDTRLFFTVVVVSSVATTSALLPSFSSVARAHTPPSTPPLRRRPLRCTVAVPQDGTVATLLDAVARLVNEAEASSRGSSTSGGAEMVAAYVGSDHFITSVLSVDKELSLLRPDAASSSTLHVFHVGAPQLPSPAPPLALGDKVEIWSGMSWRKAVVVGGANEASAAAAATGDGERPQQDHASAGLASSEGSGGGPELGSGAEGSDFVGEVECADENGTVWTALSAKAGSGGSSSVRRLRDTPVLVLVCLRVEVSVERFFVNPHRLELFGRPFALRVVPDLTTGSDLYESIWAHIGPLFDTLEEPPRSSSSSSSSTKGTPDRGGGRGRGGGGGGGSGGGGGHFKFTVRRVRAKLGAADSVSNGGAGLAPVAGGNPLLLPGGAAVPSGTNVPLEVHDEEVLLVDVPSAWMASFNRRASAFVLEHSSVLHATRERARPVDLMECLRELCEPEEVTAYSPALSQARGGEYVESVQTKASSLWRPPPVLVVVLKRFRLTPSGAKHKLSTPVVFPREGLDLSEFVGDSGANANSGQRAVYDLVSVVNHIGSLAGGHYTCFAKKRCRRLRPPKSGEGGGSSSSSGVANWALLDDSRVATVDDEDLDRVVSPQAYILVYELRDASSKELTDVYPAPAGVAPIDPATVRTQVWQPFSAPGYEARRKSRAAAACSLM